MSKILIVVPTQHEYRVFTKAFTPSAQLADVVEHCMIPMGKKSGEAIETFLRSHKRPKAVLLLGTAGALHKRLRKYDLFWASRLTTDTGIATSHENILDLSLNETTFLTSPTPIFKTQEKKERAEVASAVEMEGAHVAKVCQKEGVPFMMVRIIADSSGSFGFFQYLLSFRKCVKKLVRLLLPQLEQSVL